MRRFVLPTIAALLGAAFSAGLLRKGVVMGADSWAYWEGSVSLLEMHEYWYFGGEPIATFPPLFSWALALFQAGLGVSVQTLAIALGFFVAAASFVWTTLFTVLRARRGEPSLHDVLAAVYVPSTLAIYAQTLLSETLWLVLMPLLLLVVMAWGDQGSALRQGLRAILVWLILLGMLLCRNLTIGLLPAVLLLWIASNGGGSWTRRFAVAVAMIGSALIPWFWIRGSLGQLPYHPIGSARQGLLQHSKELLGGLAYALGPDRLWIGRVLLIAVGLLIFWEIISRPPSLRARWPRHVALVAFTVAAILGLIGLFSLTYVAEPLAGRFVAFAALALTLVVIAAGGFPPNATRQRALTAVGVVLTLVAVYRVGIKYSLAGREQPVEPLNVTISSSYWWGPPKQNGSLLLVAPPTYPWQQRSGLR